MTIAGPALPSAPICSIDLDSLFYFPNVETAQAASSSLIEQMLAHQTLVAHG
jgi:hypothetical protein